MKIVFLSKNGAVMEEAEIDTSCVPRVGELIDARSFLGTPKGEVGQFFVLSVIYEATAKGLVPHVMCRQWLKGERLRELQNHGWLPSDTEVEAYDEDYPW